MINNAYKNIRMNTQEFIKYVNIFAMSKNHAHFKHTACFSAKLWPSWIKAYNSSTENLSDINMSLSDKPWRQGSKCQLSSSIYQIMRNLNCADISRAAFKIIRGISHTIQQFVPLISRKARARVCVWGRKKSGDHNFKKQHT